jgi:hypothetical protein
VSKLNFRKKQPPAQPADQPVWEMMNERPRRSQRLFEPPGADTGGARTPDLHFVTRGGDQEAEVATQSK